MEVFRYRYIVLGYALVKRTVESSEYSHRCLDRTGLAQFRDAPLAIAEVAVSDMPRIIEATVSGDASNSCCTPEALKYDIDVLS
jgi:hypothetical protein